jgi:hypothetical protein
MKKPRVLRGFSFTGGVIRILISLHELQRSGDRSPWHCCHSVAYHVLHPPFLKDVGGGASSALERRLRLAPVFLALVRVELFRTWGYRDVLFNFKPIVRKKIGLRCEPWNT